MSINREIQRVNCMLLGLWRYARRRYILISSLVLFGLVFASFVSRDTSSAKISRILQYKDSTTTPGFLHVLVTANSADVNLCKTVISAIIAGYPTPVLVNWAKKLETRTPTFQNIHIAKVAGVHEYLQKHGQANDEDLVLVVDGYDIWFQLGPQLLLDRYLEICRRADEQLAARLGSQAIRDLNLRQRIVFGALKKCSPGGDDDLNCYAIPNSTLPRDIYGPDTDQSVVDSTEPSERFRQRYLGSGVVLGTLGEMRSMYERAMAIYLENENIMTDQALFSIIFGQQEYQREVTRLQYKSGWSRMFRSPEASILDPHVNRLKMEPKGGRSHEYGIGLDYTSSLSQATLHADRDADWIIFNDTSTIAEAYDYNKIVNPGSSSLAEDVASSLPPFWTTTRVDTNLPDDVPWADLNLYTNLFTGITPSIIHHNAHKNNLKSARESKWDQMWYHPYMRDFLRARLHEPYMPVAVTGPEGAEKAWWSPIEKRSNGLGAQPDNPEMDWLPWEKMTHKGWLQEIFRDGKGVWSEAG